MSGTRRLSRETAVENFAQARLAGVLLGSSETHYAALERAACPFCYEGWVFLGFESVNEQGEHVEQVERVPCRRCRAKSL